MAQNRESVVAAVTAIAERVGGPEGIEIVEVEYAGSGRARILRIFIDKPAGVTHADCEFVSQQVGTILDIEDVVPGDSYQLEVSSPGVERKLFKPEHYQRFTGEKAKLVLTEPVEGQKHWEGTLRGIEDNAVAVEPSPGRVIHIPLGAIKKANLKFEW